MRNLTLPLPLFDDGTTSAPASPAYDAPLGRTCTLATMPAALCNALAERLTSHAWESRDALADNTVRALRSDIAIFTRWCAETGTLALPAMPLVVAGFVDAMAESRKPATVRRYVASVAAFHRAAGIDSPTRAEAVRLALKRMARTHGTRQAQAAPLNRAAVDAMLCAADRRGRRIDLRDAALVAVAYDTLARRSELVALDVADLALADDGSGTALIRRGKTDQDGAGSTRYLGRDTVALVRRWIECAAIAEGPLFREVGRAGKRAGARLHPGAVPRIYRRLARLAGLAVVAPSGHSTRVGAAQDMIAAGLEIGEVMQAGGWRTPAMVARYSERLTARRGAAAKLAKIQGRG